MSHDADAPFERLITARVGPAGQRRAAAWLVCGLFIGPMVMAGMPMARAQSAAAPAAATPMDFNIPAQPLGSAVIAFSSASGVQVLFDTNAAAGLRSAPVRGRMTTGQALRQLIAGTGFQIRYVDAGTVTLVAPAKGASADPMVELGTVRVEATTVKIGGRQAYTPYIDRVLGSARQVLQSDKQATRGSYAILMRIWLDEEGAVTRAQIARSTGDRDRDAAYERLLATLKLDEPPPAGLPQPLIIEFWTRPRG